MRAPAITSSPRAVAVGVIGLAVLCGLGSPARPTGSGVIDALWNVATALVVIAAASRAGRWPLMWMLGVSAVLGIGGAGTGSASAVVAIALLGVLAWSGVPTPPADRAVGALAGAVAMLTITLAPSFGPTGTPTVIATAAIAPVVVSGWRNADPRARRNALVGAGLVIAGVIVAGATAAVAVASARRPLTAAESSARSALDALSRGDTELAAVAFADAGRRFDEVRTTASGPLGLVGRAVPVVAQHLTALREVSAAGATLAERAADAAGAADWRTLTASGGRVDLAAVAAMMMPANDAADATSAALEVIESVRSPWLVGPVTARLDALAEEIADVEQQAGLAASGLAVAPDLLGGNGPRRYLLALATPGESRNGGGFVGSFGVLTAIDGVLSVDTSRSTRDLASPASRAGEFTLPPDWETRYGAMRVGVFPGNLSASPSWPDDADVAGRIAALNPEIGQVDGVVYADPIALAALLDLIGPVRIPALGRDLDSSTVVDYLLIEQYVRFSRDNDQRIDALSDVTSAVFAALVDRPLPGLGRLGSVLGPVVAGGHLRVATFGSVAESEFLAGIGLDGAWRTRPGADYLSLRSANMLPTKIDVFMDRQVSVAVEFDPATGAVRSEVRATVTNNAPPRGLPPYLIGNGSLAPPGTNRNLLALYTPLDVDAVSVDGRAAGAQVQSEFGGQVVSVPVDIPPGGTVEVVWVLRGAIEPRSDYRLDVLPPSLATADRMRITVAGADPVIAFDGPLTAIERFDVPVALR